MVKDNKIGTNQVYVSGKIVSDFQAVFKSYNTRYYMADMAVRRLSSQVDYIPVVFNDWMLHMVYGHKARYISVAGQYVSYNVNENGRWRLKFYVMAEEVELGDAEGRDVDNNSIFLNGHICKKPVFRRTPLGRSITDLFVAVSCPDKKSYYFPCICWGSTAYSAAGLSVGAHIGFAGRIQSREYFKRLDDSTVERRIAYEVSINNLI